MPLLGRGIIIFPCLCRFPQKKEKGEITIQDLRKEVKLLKALQSIDYKEIAEHLEIKQSSLYSWLNGQFELSQEKQKRLLEIIEDLKE